VSATCTGAARERVLALGLDPGRLPRHLAVIMDGNGRWAVRRGWQRVRGHERGVDAVRTISTECSRLGLRWLSLYAFSSENWSRPDHEIDFLMGLLVEFMDRELPTIMDNGIRFRAIGELHRLPAAVRERIERNTAVSRENTGLTLTLALSYGGRDEIVAACRRLAVEVAAGRLRPEDIDAGRIGSALYDPEAPDVDLLVRTAAEQRVSNFLVWQAVYAEYVSLAPLWPDFQATDLHAALSEYQQRERRFGKVAEGRAPG
jgi:undecaprenyl diphosphate synthase